MYCRVLCVQGTSRRWEEGILHIPFCSVDDGGGGGGPSSETTAAVDRLNSPLVVVAEETETLLVGSDFSSSGRLETDT